MIAFRHADRRFPFLWQSSDQPAARWHAVGEGPVQYLADTPDGAWAEFLRHEEITDAADLAGIRRDLWAVELPETLALARPRVSLATATGGLDTYGACQQAARRLRALRPSVDGLEVVAAGLQPATARGYRVRAGALVPGPARDGRTLALFGLQPRLVGWRSASDAHPAPDLLARVRHL
jgi:hypothetical protein